MTTNPTPTRTYDPVKALEGMFNGSVTRIAYALKDPVNFGPSTKKILTVVAKRFHDALDDCEVQLLDAKWYLEHKLEQNRLQREAKARELGTAAKRKHDEIAESTQAQDETPTKKVKVDEVDEKLKDKVQAAPEQPKIKAEVPATKESGKQTEKINQPPKPAEEQTAQDDFIKPTPQATPAASNEEFNIESMFDDPTLDTGENGDTAFDFGMDDTFGDDQDATSLDALLPDYAIPTTEPSSKPTESDALPALSNNFDLPASNDFDDFFNDESLGANFEDNVGISDDFLNMDFENDFN